MAETIEDQSKNTADAVVDDWPKRRRLVYLGLLACLFFVCVAIFHTTLAVSIAELLITSSFGLGGAILMMYIFGVITGDYFRGKSK